MATVVFISFRRTMRWLETPVGTKTLFWTTPEEDDRDD